MVARSTGMVRDPVEAKLVNAVLEKIVPAGTVFNFAGTKAPSGWLLCDGSSYLRAQYPALYRAIGTTWGSVDAHHFNVPNFQDLFLRSSGLYHSVGQTGGNSDTQHGDVTLLATEMPLMDAANGTVVLTDPKHHHTLTQGVTDPGHTHGITDPQHSHGGGAASASNAGTSAGGAAPASTAAALTGISVQSAFTGITRDDDALTGITVVVGNASPAPIPIDPPYGVVLAIIKS